jgi:hypothetical protein
MPESTLQEPLKFSGNRREGDGREAGTNIFIYVLRGYQVRLLVKADDELYIEVVVEALYGLYH